MARDLPGYSGQRARMKWVAWCFATALFLFTVENIWIEPWLRGKYHGIPSLVPEALSGVWFVAFVIGSMILILLVVCAVLLTRDRGVSVWTKASTGIAVVVVMLVSVQWVLVTSGKPGLLSVRAASGKHTVTLTWKASTSRVIGYNVYRRVPPETNYVRINTVLVQDVIFVDRDVESGVTYAYVTRAVDVRWSESGNSNETTARIP